MKKKNFTYAKLLKTHEQLKAAQADYFKQSLVERIRILLYLGHPIVTVQLFSAKERREARGQLTGLELGRVKFVVPPFTFKPTI